MGESPLRLATAYRAGLWKSQFDVMADGRDVELRGEIFAWLEAYIIHLKDEVESSSPSTPQSGIPEQKGKTELQVARAYNENFWQSMREDARNRRQFTSRAVSIAPLMAYLAHLEREDR